MTSDTVILKGVVRGRTIELEQEPGLRDGQAVNVVLRPVLPRGEGLRRGFGSWAEDADELDRFVAKIYEDRADDRSGAGT